MKKLVRNQIKRTISEPENLARVRSMQANFSPDSITPLATEVCKVFKFYDAKGRLQISTCISALRMLGKEGFLKFKKPLVRTWKQYCLDCWLAKFAPAFSSNSESKFEVKLVVSDDDNDR